jgi:hypothetical protein
MAESISAEALRQFGRVRMGRYTKAPDPGYVVGGGSKAQNLYTIDYAHECLRHVCDRGYPVVDDFTRRRSGLRSAQAGFDRRSRASEDPYPRDSVDRVLQLRACVRRADTSAGCLLRSRQYLSAVGV